METVVNRVMHEIESVGQLSYRLVLLVGPSRAGKTRALRELSSQQAWPLVNLNLALSERLLELKSRKRALRTPGLVDDIVRATGSSVVLLDNLELLFHPDLQQDPLRLLQSIARNRTIIASWHGAITGSALTYASPDHPEFRRYENAQALIVASGGDNGRHEIRAGEESRP